MKEKRPVREYQDSVFRMLFRDKESAIELYNALEGTDFNENTEVEFTTLDDSLYHGLKNDLGFLIDEARFVMISEHQSTINENMPIRQLQYVGRTYEKILDSRRLYNKGRITLPTPLFYVLYTGEALWKKKELRLSDSYTVKKEESALELVVKVIDLRYNENNEILQKSEKLRGYSYLLHLIQQNRKSGLTLRESIDEAVLQCLQEHILEDFLVTHSSEVGSMLFHDITVEEFIELRVEEAVGEVLEEAVRKAVQSAEKEAIATGRAEGLAKGRAEGLAEGEKRMTTLYRLLKEVNRLEEYESAIEDSLKLEQLYAEFGLE
ncbi:MAG: Rpn family recombination-promoting nuclease/putative transposase [Firmicutes bacterium]|nr:Rpn family recombination-promoting nuclease/putative transposase [Bacillota bacterium]